MWSITVIDHNEDQEGNETVFYYDDNASFQLEYAKITQIRFKDKRYSFSIEVDVNVKINESIELDQTLFLSE